jgi:excisionase family DNA binding protein
MTKSEQLRAESDGPVYQSRTGFATPTEAAIYLHLSKAMVHKLVGERKIPACRYGRAVRIPWAWLLRQGEDT